MSLLPSTSFSVLWLSHILPLFFSLWDVCDVNDSDHLRLMVLLQQCIYMRFCHKICCSPFFSFRAILEPLSSLTPPAHSVFVVVDSLDSGCCGGDGAGQGLISGTVSTPSSSIAELLFRHVQLLPPWILLVCSARRQNKTICKMFSGIPQFTNHL